MKCTCGQEFEGKSVQIAGGKRRTTHLSMMRKPKSNQTIMKRRSIQKRKQRNQAL